MKKKTKDDVNEIGENDVPTQILIRSADRYDTSIDHLLDRTNDPKPPAKA